MSSSHVVMDIKDEDEWYRQVPFVRLTETDVNTIKTAVLAASLPPRDTSRIVTYCDTYDFENQNRWTRGMFLRQVGAAYSASQQSMPPDVRAIWEVPTLPPLPVSNGRIQNPGTMQPEEEEEEEVEEEEEEEEEGEEHHEVTSPV